MKRCLYTTILSLIVLGNSFLFGQQDYFTVLATQGQIFILRSSKSIWSEIKTGDKIFPGYKLKVGSDAYTALADSKGFCTDINKKGIYDYTILKNLVGDNYKSTNDKFALYLIYLFKKEEEANEMKSWASVVRVKPNNIMIGVPSSSLVIDSTIIFRWFPYPGSSNYIFKLINKNNVTLFMRALSDTSLMCNLNLFDLKKDENYKWIVFDFSRPEISTDTNYIMLPDPVSEAALRDSINQINIFTSENISAINLILSANYYIANKLNFHALNAYSKAVQLAPGVEIYKKMFANFLFRMNMAYYYE